MPAGEVEKKEFLCDVKCSKTFSDGITIGTAGGLTIEGVIQIKKGISALMSATSSTYSTGKSGQILISNGSTVYWGNPTDTKVTQAYSTATTYHPVLLTATSGITPSIPGRGTH